MRFFWVACFNLLLTTAWAQDSWTWPKETIDELSFSEPLPGTGGNLAAMPPRNKRKDAGLRILTEVGYQIGVGEIRASRAKFNFVPTYQFNYHYMLGVGIGFRHYVESKRVATPVFLHFRSIPNEEKISGFFGLSAGYSFTDLKGVMASVSAGARFKLQGRNALFASVGYEAQVAKLTSPGYFSFTELRNLGAAEISVGFVF